jgi:hypothetical protein
VVLVTRVIGDCPDCKATASYGNVDIYGDHVLRGCTQCAYEARYYLPPVRKALVYLDQFFFSGTFRGRDSRFLEAATRVRDLADKQLLVSPYSSVHSDETHQWERRGELFEFIKAASRGHQFKPAYQIEQEQVLNAFEAWLADKPPTYQVDRREALERSVDQWDGYFRIDVDRYRGDIELLRTLKRQTVTDLVDIFPQWRNSKATFEEDVALETRDAGRIYLDAYLKYVVRIGIGDYQALIDSPIISMIVQYMLHYLPKELAPEEQLRKCVEFFASEHFAAQPFHDVQARTFATLKMMVKNGAYTNRESALERLSGFFYDLKHIATYAPYCQAFVIDQPMAALMSQPTVALERRYGVRVFSLSNWDQFMSWLDGLQEAMSDEHEVALRAAYL